MRCLYCGKELALLKRWTGGGEFCSDAHRQQYQEEYNQLALNRLLQAKPQADSSKKSDSKTPEPAVSEQKAPEHKTKDIAPAPPVEAPRAPQPRVEAVAAAPPPAPAQIAAPRVPEPLPEPEPELETEIEEEPAPAELYGFFLEFPVPVDAPVLAAAGELGGFDQTVAPAFPHRDPAPWETTLVPAGHVFFAPTTRVMDYAAHTGERHIEVREFVRSFPAFQFDAPFALAPAGETGLLQTSEESMEILIFPHPPQGSPPLWQEGATPFTFGHELGSLARATFRTTGLEDHDEAVDPMPVEAIAEQVVEPAAPPAPQAAPEAPPVPVVPVKAVATPVVPPPPVRPVVKDTPEQKSDPVPDLITRPLPVTLHGLTAGRGKPVQVFPTAVVSAHDIQAPRSTALPLRPVMTLGPAPAPSKEERKHSERTVLVKPDPRKSPQGRPDPRFANGKNRKQEPRPEPEAAAPPVPAPPPKEEPKPVPVVVAASVKEPPVAAAPVEAKKPVPAPVEPKPEPAPEPFARQYQSSDLGLPKLNFESGGFWSKLPPAGKIGIAAVVVLAVVGFAILALRGSGSPVAANGPQVVTGSPLPAMEGGWITDWGAEPGVRRERDISILRPSLNLSDYRIEFQAQMEGKAIGWVFRAKDGKNFYVSKLEVVTPGLEPKVAVVHFAVVDGIPQPRAQSSLPMNVRIDTLYRIRFDAVGDHFSTYVQDEKVDDWTDDRLKLGGVGLYSDRGETMPRPRTVSVVPLVIKR